MSEFLLYVVLGLGAGSLYALLGQGIVLAHRGAGVINLAHGAMALYVAYTFAGLRQGRLVIPPVPNPLDLMEWAIRLAGGDLSLPDIPAFVTLDSPVDTGFAFVISLIVAALLGLAIHFMVFRLLRGASQLAKTIASVGVMLSLQAIVILRFGTENVPVPPVLPTGQVPLGVGTAPADRFYFLALTILVTIGLALIFRCTRLGLATRAAAENERGAVLLGLAPDRLAAGNWVMSSVVAGAAGIVASSLSGLNPTDLVVLVIPALGAALLARFQSFFVTMIAGVLMGVVQSLTVLLQQQNSWFPVGSAGGIPFIVIIVGMLFLGRRLPERGDLLKVGLPFSPEPKATVRWACVLVPITVAGLIFFPYDLRGAILNTLVAVVLSLSFVVTVGFAGQISLMQMALAGSAAILLTRLAGDLALPFPLGPVLAVLGAAAVGVVAGLPALRVRGVQLAVLTLGAAYAFEQMVLQNPAYLRASDFGSIPPPSLFGKEFGVNGSFPIGSPGTPNAVFGMFVLVVVLLAVWVVVAVRRSDLGRRMLAVRANERAAASVGISVTRTKLLAFAIGAILAGAAGVLISYQFQGVTPTPFVAIASVSALAVAYVGGISRVSGAVIAGMLVIGGIIPRVIERLVEMGRYEPLLLGIGLVLTVVLNPQGISGLLHESVKSAFARWTERSVAPGPTEPESHAESRVTQSDQWSERKAGASS